MPAKPPTREVPLLELLGQGRSREPKAALAGTGPAMATDGSRALTHGVFISRATVRVVSARAELAIRVEAGRGTDAVEKVIMEDPS